MSHTPHPHTTAPPVAAAPPVTAAGSDQRTAQDAVQSPLQDRLQTTVEGTDVMAVLGLVFAFVAPPVGIVLSALGLRGTRRNGTGGRGLAVAGMVLSLVFTLAIVLLFAVPLLTDW